MTTMFHREPLHCQPASDDAAGVVQEMHDMVYNLLRDRYPFMKAAVLNGMIESFAQSARTVIEQQATAMANTRSSFSFFSIPPELREQIYQYALVKPRNSDCKRYDEIDVKKPWPPLLEVCKEIRHEATPIFLGQNTFYSDCNDFEKREIRAWLRMLGKERAGMLKEVIIDLWDHDGTEFEDEINRRPGQKLAVNKENVLKLFKLEKYGVAHEALVVQYGHDCLEDDGQVFKLLDDGSSVVLGGY